MHTCCADFRSTLSFFERHPDRASFLVSLTETTVVHESVTYKRDKRCVPRTAILALGQIKLSFSQRELFLWPFPEETYLKFGRVLEYLSDDL